MSHNYLLLRFYVNVSIGISFKHENETVLSFPTYNTTHSRYLKLVLPIFFSMKVQNQANHHGTMNSLFIQVSVDKDKYIATNK